MKLERRSIIFFILGFIMAVFLIGISVDSTAWLNEDIQYLRKFATADARRAAEHLTALAAIQTMEAQLAVVNQTAIALQQTAIAETLTQISEGTVIPISGLTYTPTLSMTFVPLETSTSTLPPTGTLTPDGGITPTFTFTPTFLPTLTRTPTLEHTPNPTETLQAAFAEVDAQFQNSMRSYIAFNKPESMKKGDTTTIELLLNPSLPPTALAAEAMERGSFVTSTAEPGQLIDPGGREVAVETSNIEITNRMKAVLVSEDPEAFAVQELHDNAEQVISTIDTTVWRWSITAKVEGTKTLELIVYRLVKYEGEDYWREVETYRADIVVEVTPIDRIKSLDWKWIVGIVITLLLIPGFWRWFDKRKSEPSEKQPTSTKSKK